MITVVKGKIVDVLSKPWEMNGKTGVSHKIAVSDGNSITNIGISESDIPMFKSMIGSEEEFDCDIFIKGSYNLRIHDPQ